MSVLADQTSALAELTLFQSVKPSQVEPTWSAAGVEYQRKFASARAAAKDQEPCELTINQLPVNSVICWDYIRGLPCRCDGTRAHVLQGACSSAINAAIGRRVRTGCRPGLSSCASSSHPSVDELCAALALWWREVECSMKFSIEGPMECSMECSAGARRARTRVW